MIESIAIIILIFVRIFYLAAAWRNKSSPKSLASHKSNKSRIVLRRLQRSIAFAQGRIKQYTSTSISIKLICTAKIHKTKAEKESYGQKEEREATKNKITNTTWMKVGNKMMRTSMTSRKFWTSSPKDCKIWTDCIPMSKVKSVRINNNFSKNSKISSVQIC